MAIQQADQIAFKSEIRSGVVNNNNAILYNNDVDLQSQIELYKLRLDNHVTDLLELHKGSGVINDSNANGVKITDAINDILLQINALVVSGTEVDPRLTLALIDVESTDWTIQGFKALQDSWQTRIKAIEADIKEINAVIYQPKFKTMTVLIDTANSNPETALTYANDAIGMTPASDEWDEFFGHRPCLFKDGKVVGYLNPNDFTKFIDGRDADITSGNAGDVMIEFPRRGISIQTLGTVVSISMTGGGNDPTFDYFAHNRGFTKMNNFYLGAYKGYGIGSKLRSLSGYLPTVDKNIGDFRDLAQANGEGYEQSGFYQLTFRQAMYVLKYKNLNSQTVLGRGYVDGNASSIVTGGADLKGMDFGEGTGKLQMKLFGLEDYWGNVYEWIDGLATNSNRDLLTGNDDFNDTGSGYLNNGQGATSDIGGYINKIQGSTTTGFMAKEVSGGSTTYYCDYANLYASRVAYFGGYWASGSYAGAFQLHVYNSVTSAYSYVASRLMFL